VILARITLMVLGTVAILYAVSTTLASVLLFGGRLMLAGFMQIVQHAFRVRASPSPGRDHPRDGRNAARDVPRIRRADDARPERLPHRWRRLQDDRVDRTAVPSWGWSVASGLLSVALDVMLAIQKSAFSRALDEFNHASERVQATLRPAHGLPTLAIGGCKV
jgi:hypothetical protein